MEIDELEERKHVTAGMTAAGVVEHFGGDDVHRREQIDASVTLVVVRNRLTPAGLDWQRWLRPIMRLTLGLFVEREHQRAFRRIEMQPDDIDEPRFEIGVVRQLKRVDLPRPQIHHPQYPHHGIFAETVLCGERPRRPARRSVSGNGV